MLTRDDIARIHDAELAVFARTPPERPHLFSVRVTSGTMGHMPIVALADHTISLDTFSSLFWEKERTLICVGTRGLRFYYTSLASERPEGARILTLDRDDLHEHLSHMIAEFAPEKIIGFPTFVIEVGARMRREDAEAVRSLVCAGERITPQYESRLRELFPNARFSWFYGVIEMRNISKESCVYLRPNQYHPNIHVTVEIVDADEHGYGDVLVSSRIGTTPVERYQIGDTARFIEGMCGCGEAVTFELAGRRGFDYLKLGGALLIQDEFDRVLATFRKVIDDYRVEATMVREGNSFIGRIHIIARAAVAPSERLQHEVARGIERALFLTADKTFADLIEERCMLPLSIMWTDALFPDSYKAARIRIV